MTGLRDSPIQQASVPNSKMKSLREIDIQEIEQMIKEELGRHMRTWAGFDYFVVDDFRVIVNVYTWNNLPPAFSVIMEFGDGKLYVVEVNGIKAMVPFMG